MIQFSDDQVRRMIATLRGTCSLQDATMLLGELEALLNWRTHAERLAAGASQADRQQQMAALSRAHLQAIGLREKLQEARAQLPVVPDGMVQQALTMEHQLAVADSEWRTVCHAAKAIEDENRPKRGKRMLEV
jgi:hypothetical protein